MAGMEWILTMGLAGGLAGVLYLIFKSALGKRFSMTGRCLCLACIAALYLVPAGFFLPSVSISGEAPLNAFVRREPDIPKTDAGNEAAGQLQEEELTAGTNAADVQPLTAAPEPEQDKGNPAVSDWFSWKLVFVLWVLVCAASLAVKGIRYRRFYRSCIRNSAPAGEDILAFAEEEGKRLGLGGTIAVRCWKQKPELSPSFVLGIRKPMLLLPNAFPTEEALRLTLDHELMHIRNRHLWLKAAAELAVSVHWYHPMAYWLRMECDSVCEYAVDEALAGQFSQDRRKAYCQLLLNEAARQTAGSRFVSGMVPEKKKLKERMMSIMGYRQLTGKGKAVTAGLLAAGLAVCLFTEACVAGPIREQGSGERQAAGVVYVGEDGLYHLNLAENQVTQLDNGTAIKLPKVSPKGSYVAYLKEDTLYCAGIGGGEPRLIAEGAQSYCWYDDTSLLHSIQDYKQNGEILRTWVNSEKTETYGDPQHMYSDLTTDGNGTIFAEKSQISKDGEETKNAPAGVISLSMKDGTERTLIEAVSYADERYDLGSSYQPQIESISKDGRYLYLWDRTQSGSTTADGVRLGIYDLQEGVYMRMVEGNLVTGPITPEEPWDMYILLNKSNVSVSPKNPLLLAANLGSGREMYVNKQLGLVDFTEGTETMLTDASLVTETVSFSLDGKSIYYAAGPEFTIEEQRLDSEALSQLWYSREHSIYKMDLESGQTVQMTKGHFDLLPREISPGKFLFVREEGDRASLWQSDGTSETKLADGINFDSEYAEVRFYFAVRPDRVMDLVYQ